MYSRSYTAWMRTGLDAWMLGAEASLVIGLRTALIASGGTAAASEAALMVSEKVGAALELQSNLARDGAGLTPLRGTQKALRHYRRKVEANRKRLCR